MATTTSKVSPVGNNYYKTSVTTNADGSLSATTYRTDAKGGGAVAVSSVNTDANGKSTRTYESGATDAEKKAFADPNSPERKAYTQQVQSQNPYGPNPTAQQTKALNSASGKSNTAPNDGGQQNQGSSAAPPSIGEAKARTKYPEGLKYPSDLQTSHQDVIKFSMLKYEPRSLSEGGSIGTFENRNQNRTSIGWVFLPIPGGISDTNAVTWGSDSLTATEKGFADIANAFISGGGDAAAKEVAEKATGLSNSSSEVQSALKAYFTGEAIKKTNILARTQGAIQNPNMELLFSAPTLRPFSFTFKLSARGQKDKDQITKIIRFFKQGMSVQRTESQLFLKAPNTFKIEYLHQGENHKYINKIKECALQSFTVNYTPEGNYMTFSDGLMTSYEITMQFQELEPIFNDDYPEDNDASIGY